MKGNPEKQFVRRNAVISGSGSCLPGVPVPNARLIREYNLDTTDDWLCENVGVRVRHFASPGEAASDLGARAAQRALEHAGLRAEDLERIIFCSSSADWTSPAAASNIQRLIGARCPAEDKQVACAGFIFGVDQAMRLIATGCRHVLVVAGEVKSRFVRRDDRRLSPIFADGAAAWVISAVNGQTAHGLLDCLLWTDGEMVQNMITPAGGSAMPATAETIARDLHTVCMNANGNVIANDAVYHLTRLSREICSKNEIGLGDVDIFIPHQANLLIMKRTAGELGIPLERMVRTIQETGNIVTATIPYSFDVAMRGGRLAAGMLVLMTTVGAGYAGGALLYRVPADH